MIHVSYDNEHLSGKLECSICRGSFDVFSNVHTYPEDGVERTYPDARTLVHSHFHRDANAPVAECTGQVPIGTTPWEAVDRRDGRTLARGRVENPRHGNGIGPVRVEQDEPVS